MDRKHLAETVSRRDADAEPPRMGSRRVSARCYRFMSVVNNDFRYIHWHRDMNFASPPKTRRRPIHGGSNPYPTTTDGGSAGFSGAKTCMWGTVFCGDTKFMPLIFVEQQCMYRMYGSRVTQVQLPWRNCQGRGTFTETKNINN